MDLFGDKGVVFECLGKQKKIIIQNILPANGINAHTVAISK